MILYHCMSADHTIVAYFCKNSQRGIHSDKDTVSDSGAMDDRAVPNDHIIADDDVRDPCMNDTVILDARIAPDSNSESIRS